ncbi:alpha/beta fold hydrolase [Paracoccaceae bacterium GXU_MW_L88]
MSELARQEFGEGGVPLVIVHGLFGSGRNWRAIAKKLARERRVVTVDLRNHGDSFHADSQTYADMAGDLAKVLESFDQPADLIGHSMGGKTSMVLALTRPELIRKLLVADIAPVAYTHTQEHYIDAMESIDLSKVKTRSDADAQLAEVVHEKGLRAFFLQSLNIEDGKVSWALNLDVLRKDMATVVGFPKMDGQFEGRTLFLRGAESDYVDDAGREEIERLFPNSRIVSLKGAGHWLHADKPYEFMQAAELFFAGEPT